MIKLRDAKYCNLKLLLIFLVIYGHLLEARIGESEICLIQYRLIYIIHMPLFSFLSGLFIKDAKSCTTLFKHTFPLYVILQTLATFLGNDNVKLFTPFWHLWYLLSYCIWLGLAWLWFYLFERKASLLILICSITFGCIIGFIPSIGRELSLSRTFVFLPYFFAGLISPSSFSWGKIRFIGFIAFAVFIVLYLTIGNTLPVSFLYQASPYTAPQEDFVLRLLCYFLGGTLGLFLLTIIPTRRFPFTKIGANTMPAYLLHAPIVLYIREWNIPWPFYIIITIAFLYLTDILLRWHSKLYGIVPVERRDTT